MTRVAAVDCGTNSIRLLIHDSSAGEICREMTIVRLGEDAVLHVDDEQGLVRAVGERRHGERPTIR